MNSYGVLVPLIIEDLQTCDPYGVESSFNARDRKVDEGNLRKEVASREQLLYQNLEIDLSVLAVHYSLLHLFRDSQRTGRSYGARRSSAYVGLQTGRPYGTFSYVQLYSRTAFTQDTSTLPPS